VAHELGKPLLAILPVCSSSVPFNALPSDEFFQDLRFFFLPHREGPTLCRRGCGVVVREVFAESRIIVVRLVWRWGRPVLHCAVAAAAGVRGLVAAVDGSISGDRLSVLAQV
jgi:hypothetical protein